MLRNVTPIKRIREQRVSAHLVFFESLFEYELNLKLGLGLGLGLG